MQHKSGLDLNPSAVDGNSAFSDLRMHNSRVQRTRKFVCGTISDGKFPLRHRSFRKDKISRRKNPSTDDFAVNTERHRMKYLHTMVRVSDLDASLDFYCAKLGLVELRRVENEAGRFTLIFLAAPGDAIGDAVSPLLELTYNWDRQSYDSGRNFGHLAFSVGDIYALCETLMAAGIVINRPPRDGHMAFVRSPDGISIELLQDGSLPPREPWASMPNTGNW
jgi:lactoylglutathione lyase